MDTFVGRTQKAFGKFTYAVSLATVFVALISWSQLYWSGAFSLTGDIKNVHPRMQWQTSRRYGGSTNRPKENAFFRFDMQADLTPLWNWNTKQVFVYVTADYNTTSPKTGVQSGNSVVIWDRIVSSVDKANITLRQTASKYNVWDLQKKFGGPDREVRMVLHWNVQPRAGFLVYGDAEIAQNVVQLPENK